MRRLAITTLAALLALLGASVSTAWTAPTTPPDDACHQLSPIALPCVGGDKVVESLAAECRRLGFPDSQCVLPLGHKVTAAARDAYLRSWTHRAAQFQYALGNGLPLGRAQWLGTHNSFNSVNDTFTISHSDSNQQLSLTQQLDVDIRAIEIDVHEIGGRPVVCHARGPDEGNAGCTNEPPLSAVLPKIAAWLNGHPSQVALLYLEDELGNNPAALTQTVAQLDQRLRRPDGSSLIYKPNLAGVNSKGCVPMPLGVSRDTIRRAGAQVMLVGNCVKGWASDVYGWDSTHVESGSTARYAAFPKCDATYSRSVYDTKLVRYYEDSTLVAVTVAPSTPPVNPQALTPAKVAAMIRCGVNLFGFDQLLPDDGRIEASIWSWAPGQPDSGRGGCAVQRSDSRWATLACTRRRPAACRTANGPKITRPAMTFGLAASRCRKLGGTFAPPRTGYENALVRQAAGRREVWLGYRLSRAR